MKRLIFIFFLCGFCVPVAVTAGFLEDLRKQNQEDIAKYGAIYCAYQSGEVGALPNRLLASTAGVAGCEGAPFFGAVFDNKQAAEAHAGRSKTRVESYRRAAERGDVDAQFNLAKAMFSNQREVGRHWFQKAAEGGHRNAQAILGEQLINDDSAQAMYWLQKALMQGSSSAARAIGGMYHKGNGVPLDGTLAYAYYTIAMTLGGDEKEVAFYYRSFLDKKPAVIEWQGRVIRGPEPLGSYEKRQAKAMAHKIWAKIQAARSGKSGDSSAVAKKRGSTGTGFFINHQGHIITNSHVVKGCKQMFTLHKGERADASMVSNDPRNDLALLKSSTRPTAIAYFRSGRGIRAGEDILAFGYPLKSVLSDELKGTKGMVNALAGLGNDTRFMQVSAPVQPGNSGGPLLDQSGNVVGVVTLKMNAVKMAKYTGDIPQNVNFALKASLVRDMLEVKDIDYETASSKRELKTVDIFDKAKKFTVLVECLQ